MPYFEVGAKGGTNVERAFQVLSSVLVNLSVKRLQEIAYEGLAREAVPESLPCVELIQLDNAIVKEQRRGTCNC